jgi:hypothetical protein
MIFAGRANGGDYMPFKPVRSTGHDKLDHRKPAIARAAVAMLFGAILCGWFTAGVFPLT